MTVSDLITQLRALHGDQDLRAVQIVIWVPTQEPGAFVSLRVAIADVGVDRGVAQIGGYTNEIEAEELMEFAEDVAKKTPARTH